MKIILTKDTEDHKKGDKGTLIGKMAKNDHYRANPGRGVLSTYIVKFEDGKQEYIFSQQFDVYDQL